MTTTEKEIKKMFELAEKDNSINDIAKLLGKHRSTVSNYLSSDPEKLKRRDEKMANGVITQMFKEGYLEDETMSLIYSLKSQVNEIDITLYDYLKEYKDIMSKFLRITSKPSWFFYVFGQITHLAVYNPNIKEVDLMNAVGNWYQRELDLEAAEDYLSEIQEKTEIIINNLKEDKALFDEEYKKQIKELETAKNTNEYKSNKLLNNTKKELKLLQEKINNAQKQYEAITSVKDALMKEVEEKLIARNTSEKEVFGLKKENQELKKQLAVFNVVFNEVSARNPQLLSNIIQKIENEKQ